jgi:hypothetical protein
MPLVTKAASSDDYASRFAKAQMLAKRGDDAGASKIYQDLIKRDPSQPQAYNNLAAIKARHGEFKEAQALLEQALRSNPVYATVYENLSAIYVEMARDSYGKALRLETPPQTLALRELNQPKQSKPAQIQIAAAPAETTRPSAKSSSVVATPEVTPPAAAPEKTPVAKSTFSPVVATAPATQPETTVAQTSAPATEKSPAPMVTAKSNIAKTEAVTTPNTAPEMAAAETSPIVDTAAPPVVPTPKPKTVSPPVNTAVAPTVSKEDVITNLQGWAAAWSDKAVDLYLVFYADDYAPPGMTHTQWVAQRRERLQAPKWIQVSLSDFQVDAIKDDEARVRLIQEYKADNYQDRTRKEFRLRHTPDGWRIVKETTMAKLH